MIDFKINWDAVRTAWQHRFAIAWTTALSWFMVVQTVSFIGYRKEIFDVKDEKIEDKKKPLDSIKIPPRIEIDRGDSLVVDNDNQLKHKTKITDSTYITNNFQLWEIKSKDCEKPSDRVKVNIRITLDILEVLRAYFAKPVHVNSLFRSKAHNATVDGAVANSQHIEGKAADIWIEGISPTVLAKTINNLIDRGIIRDSVVIVYANHVHIHWL